MSEVKTNLCQRPLRVSKTHTYSCEHFKRHFHERLQVDESQDGGPSWHRPALVGTSSPGLERERAIEWEKRLERCHRISAYLQSTENDHKRTQFFSKAAYYKHISLKASVDDSCLLLLQVCEKNWIKDLAHFQFISANVKLIGHTLQEVEFYWQEEEFTEL